MLLTNRIYDILKWIALYFLPAGGALYFAVSKIWGLPYGEEILGTLAAVIAFLGAILGISSNAYKKAAPPAPDPLKEIVEEPTVG